MMRASARMPANAWKTRLPANRRLFGPGKPPKQLADFRSDPLELFAVDGRKFLQDFFAAASHSNEHPAAVHGGRQPNNHLFIRQPVNQTHRAMGAKLQAFRQFAHSDSLTGGKTLDGQQCLILLRRDAGRLGGFLAKTDEPQQRVTKRRKCFIVRLDELSGFRHCSAYLSRSQTNRSFDIYRITI